MFIAALFLINNSACKKKNFFSSGHLEFSQDTVFFDTIFTTIGSTTKRFKIYNKHNQKLKIDQIRLSGGSSSPFRINVDGVPGTLFSDIEIQKNDSLYVFVEVTLDPNNTTNPIVIEDQIIFTTNGKDQTVQLVVWGQDAYFHYSYISQGIFDLNEGTWPNDKPHVIYGAAFVDSAKTLNIPGGTQIYLHKNAVLYVYKGTLNIQGSLGNEVTLQGDRLESFYNDITGQYYGIYFNKAQSSSIDYCKIKNATAGIHLYDEDPNNSGYTLQLKNTTIENCEAYGVFIFSGAKVKAENCLIYKNGIHALVVVGGGDFNFNHCHLLGYGTGSNVGSAVGVSNHYYDPNTNTTTIASINEGIIKNSVLYGYHTHELAFDTIPNSAITLNFDIQHNLIKSDDVFSSPIFSNNIWNQSPLFNNINDNDFKFPANSPLNNTGTPTSVSTDIEGNPRANPPDIGAYEL